MHTRASAASVTDTLVTDRRKKNGASSPTDVWALGCLFYELLTGEYMFYDDDWVRFYLRVTASGQVSMRVFVALH